MLQLPLYPVSIMHVRLMGAVAKCKIVSCQASYLSREMSRIEIMSVIITIVCVYQNVFSYMFLCSSFCNLHTIHICGI